MKRALLVIALSFLAASAHAQQDMADLSACQIVAAPAEVKGWPVTKAITAVELKSARVNDSGVRATLAPNNPRTNADTWPDFVPPGWDGPLRSTLWLFIFPRGKCIGSAFIEFWGDRQWTGAPLLTDYKEWAYANPGSPWGPMGDYKPKAGDTVGFMYTAGQLRMNKGLFTVRERSNLVTVKLAADALVTFDGAVPAPAPPVVTPPVVTPPPVMPAPLDPRLTALEGAVQAINERIDMALSAHNVLVSQVLGYRVDLDSLAGRISALEARRVPVSCSAGLNLGLRIPISCRLE